MLASIFYLLNMFQIFWWDLVHVKALQVLADSWFPLVRIKPIRGNSQKLTLYWQLASLFSQLGKIRHLTVYCLEHILSKLLWIFFVKENNPILLKFKCYFIFLLRINGEEMHKICVQFWTVAFTWIHSILWIEDLWFYEGQGCISHIFSCILWIRLCIWKVNQINFKE